MPSRMRFATLLAAAPLLLASSGGMPARAPVAELAPQPRPRAPFRIPSEKLLTDSVHRATVLRGRAILLATRDSLPRNVGNSLRCASCHLDGGLRPNAMPWVGSYARFPQYRTRSGKVDLIEDRVNDCFERSMNGRRLDATGRDMRAIVSYFAFLSNGIPVGVEMEGQGFPRIPPMKGDLQRGAALFGVEKATDSPEEAYRRFPERRVPTSYRTGWLPER